MVYVNCTINTDVGKAIIDRIIKNFEQLGCFGVLNMVNWPKCDNRHLDEMLILSELNEESIAPFVVLIILLILTIIVYFVISWIDTQVSIYFLNIELSIEYMMCIWMIFVLIIFYVVHCKFALSCRLMRYLNDNDLLR